MTPQQQLAYIKSKCIEANGSILDLKMGCDVKIGDFKRTVFEVFYDDDENVEKILTESSSIGMFQYTTPGAFEIIGRPITLPDVLLAMQHHLVNNMLIDFDTIDGEPDHCRFVSHDNKKALWNLLLPLDGQKEEVWAFLYELLHV